MKGASMEDQLIEILQRFNVPVYRQGSLSDDEAYPETFFTFWNNASPDHAHYDNDGFGSAWDYTIFVYSSDPALLYDLLMQARTALRAAGWSVPSKGYDVMSDEATHTGRALEVFYLEV